MLNLPLQSLSKWNPLVFYQPQALHGEKFSQLNTVLNLDNANLDLTDMEASVLHCVNPYDVNPIGGIVQDKTATVGKPVKLEMEEFSDLAPFLPQAVPKATTNSTDELNTPIFGKSELEFVKDRSVMGILPVADRKGPFNFMVSENTYIDSTSAADPFKFEYDTIRSGDSVLSNKPPNDFSVYSNVNVQLQDNDNSEVVNIVQDSEANLLFTTSESDQGNIYIIDNTNETPSHVQGEDQISANVFKIEDHNSVISVKSYEGQYSNVSSPCDEYSMNTNASTIEAQYKNITSPRSWKKLGIETPEDSNSSCATPPTPIKKVPKLKLNITYNDNVILNTPDVIDSVVDLETNFNILDYINEKEVTTVNIEDIHFEDPSTSRGLRSTETDYVTPTKRKRKIKCYSDDDEDYVPPSKKQSTCKKEPLDSSDSESEIEVYKTRKGRPSRRTSSVSSDHSDASKYRELRDKNNEASRKSRLKRKMKDLSLQKEADELYEKNVKLKAQVEEYERMVNTFRNNLFKIMLKK